MKKYLGFAIVSILFSAQAFAESDIYIEGSLAHADSRLSLDGIDAPQYARRALGYGFGFGIFVNERVSVGFSHVQLLHSDLDSRTGYSDNSFGLRSDYNYLHVGDLRLSVGGGLSWHQIDTEDSQDSIYIKTVIEPANTLNYNAGFGARYNFYDKVEAGIDFRWSSTLLKGDASVKRETYLGTEEVREIRNFGLDSRVLLISLGFRS